MSTLNAPAATKAYAPNPFQADCARKANGLRDYNDRRKRLGTCGICGVIRQYHEREVQGHSFRAMTASEWAKECGVEVAQEQKADFSRAVVEIAEPEAGGLGIWRFGLQCGHFVRRSFWRVPIVKVPKALKCEKCEREARKARVEVMEEAHA